MVDLHRRQPFRHTACASGEPNLDILFLLAKGSTTIRTWKPLIKRKPFQFRIRTLLGWDRPKKRKDGENRDVGVTFARERLLEDTVIIDSRMDELIG